MKEVIATTKLTQNKLRNIRRVLYWIAQQQKACPICGKPLLPTGKDKDVYNLTFHHGSGNYDHKKKAERGRPKGGYLMHKPCHKAQHMKESKVYKYRKNIKGSLQNLNVGESLVVGVDTKDMELVDMFNEMKKYDRSLVDKLDKLETKE